MEVEASSEESARRSMQQQQASLLPAKAVEVVADLFTVADSKRQSEVALLDQLKKRATDDYLSKGFHLLGFEVLQLQLENGANNEPDQSLKAFFNGTYGRVKATDGLRARCKLLLLPVDEKSTTGSAPASTPVLAQSTAPATPRESSKESKPSELAEDTYSVDSSEESAGGTKAPAVATATASTADGASAKAAITAPYDPAGFLNGPDQLEEVVSASPLGCSVLRLFEACVSDDSDLELRYHEARGDTEISIGKWTDDPQFGKVRSNSYIVKLSDPIGPKSSRSEEQQRYTLQEDKLMLETFSFMLDAPFADRFRVESIIEATATGASSCNVTIRCKPVFTGKTILEGTITKKTMKGMSGSMQQWFDMARERVEGSSGGSGAAPHEAAMATAAADQGTATAKATVKSEPKGAPARADDDRLVVELDLSVVAEVVGEVIKYRVVLIPLLLNILLTTWVLARH